MYVCLELDDNGQCAVWAEQFTLLPSLSTGEAVEIAAYAFMVWAVAWGVRQVVALIINR